MNLIKITREARAKWHIPRDAADLEEEEIWAVTTMCNETMIYEGKVPEGWMRLSDGLSENEFCSKCLKLRRRS